MSSMSGATGFQGSSKRTGDIIPKGYEKGQLSQYNPQQTQLFNQSINNVGPNSYLSKLAGGDQSTFEQLEAPAMRQFQGLQGQLASRFSGQGLGGRHSSGFQNESSAAASNFAQELAARRQALQQEAIQGLHGMSMDLLNQRPNEKFLTEKYQKPNPWADIAGKFAGAIPGAVAGFMAGGPAGAAVGGIGSFASQSANSAATGYR